jgi:RimJ/RimL family protein N-acetyltransferase
MDYKALDMAYRRLAGLPWEILRTQNCIIRETTVEDVDAFYQIYDSPEITQYTDGLCAVREEEIAYIEDYIRKVYYFYGYGMWTVVERESGCVIGRAGISWREGYELPELGFLIGIPWQGRGIAYEVCRAILTYAKEELEITRVQTLVMEGNEKSLNLVKKLGFARQREVILPDGRRAGLFTRAETCDKIGHG